MKTLIYSESEKLLDGFKFGHSFLGAAILAVLVSVVGIRSWPWVLGAFLGSFSHVPLDSRVHPDMVPFHTAGNPLYMGWMQGISLLLLPLTAWLIVQSVSSTLGWVRRRWEEQRARTPERNA